MALLPTHAPTFGGLAQSDLVLHVSRRKIHNRTQGLLHEAAVVDKALHQPTAADHRYDPTNTTRKDKVRNDEVGIEWATARQMKTPGGISDK